jgi:hypothetical protein
MEDLRITDLGIAGAVLFMTFQYIVKPVIASVLERRRNGHGGDEIGPALPPGEAENRIATNVMEDMRELELNKVDKTTCKLIHHHIDDTFRGLMTGQGELKHGMSLMTEQLSGINREVGEIKSAMVLNKTK